MCDIRLFRSARMDFETAKTLWKMTWEDEMILNNAAYHLQGGGEGFKGGVGMCGRNRAEYT